ncbi:MAG: IPTL-CTERM sorting domain-containing protein [Candidatus Dadabacteria bacterium]|nr:IPTL-CTERM sorting domain-containing protein [Candidatus Dadabacteria bacterium]
MFRFTAALSILAFLVLFSAPADARTVLTDIGTGSDTDFGGTEGTVEFFSEGAPGNLDVVICSTFSTGTNNFLTPVPGDWSPVGESSCGGGSCILGIYTRPAEAGPGETTCRWQQSTDTFTAAILRYAGADADDPVIASACASEVSGILSAPSVVTEANSTVLRVFALGGDELLMPSQEIPEASFSAAALSSSDQFSLILGASSYVPTAGPTEELVLPIGIPIPWTACTIALRSATTPIPAMSEWGLLAFAGIAGIASLIAIRRRAKTA